MHATRIKQALGVVYEIAKLNLPSYLDVELDPGLPVQTIQHNHLAMQSTGSVEVGQPQPPVEGIVIHRLNGNARGRV